MGKKLGLIGKALIAAAIASACFVGSTLEASAYATFNDHKLIYGIGGGKQHYWIAPSAKKFTSIADESMKNWINTSTRIGIRTPLYWTKTGTKSAARMEIHKGAYMSNACAITKLYVKNTDVSNPPGSAPKRNWVWGKIILSSGYDDVKECPNTYGIMSHEMGHVFGLAHTMDENVLMYRWVYRTNVKWATKDEANGINHLYKK